WGAPTLCSFVIHHTERECAAGTFPSADALAEQSLHTTREGRFSSRHWDPGQLRQPPEIVAGSTGSGAAFSRCRFRKKLASGVARLMAGDIDDGHAEAERDRDHSSPFCLPSALSNRARRPDESDALRIAGKPARSQVLG